MNKLLESLTPSSPCTQSSTHDSSVSDFPLITLSVSIPEGSGIHSRWEGITYRDVSNNHVMVCVRRVGTVGSHYHSWAEETEQEVEQ